MTTSSVEAWQTRPRDRRHDDLSGLGDVNRELVQELGRRCPDQRIATVDLDATIIESHKQQALRSDEGERGYQPMLAVWAEMDVILADEFGDGNVPVMMAALPVAQRAFAALPAAIVKIPEEKWEVYGKEHRQEIRERAEVDFVPGEKSENKDTKPLRYVAIRLRQRQEELFADGSKVKTFREGEQRLGVESGAADRVASGKGGNHGRRCTT